MGCETRQVDTTIHSDRITRWILIAIGVYTCLLVTLLNIFLLGSGKPVDRAVILMADGLILFWIVIGGSLTPILRRKLVLKLTAIPIGWRIRFVLFCTVMALLEEVITTTMTNLAPVFGTTPEEAHITASTNYFVVVCFHSVVVFVPMFFACGRGGRGVRSCVRFSIGGTGSTAVRVRANPGPRIRQHGPDWKRRRVVRLTGYAADAYVSDPDNSLARPNNVISVTGGSDGVAHGGQTAPRIIAFSRIPLSTSRQCHTRSWHRRRRLPAVWHGLLVSRGRGRSGVLVADALPARTPNDAISVTAESESAARGGQTALRINAFARITTVNE